MRKKIIAGNWKMNLTLDKATKLTKDLEAQSIPQETEVVTFVPSIYLLPCLSLSKQSKIGVQNFYHEKEGAYTGEVSAYQIDSTGAKWVLTGHSERRQYFGETNEDVNKKNLSAIALDLTVVYCIGETWEQREKDQHFKIIETQISEGLKGISASQMKSIVLAYEPVWAIGTGKTASPEQAQEIHAFIREIVAKIYDKNIADDVSILYGGSCKPGNAKEIFSNADVDGGLIGGASLVASDFIEIVKAIS